MPSNIVVPEVGESIVDARVAKWLRHEGDAVAAGDPLVELETDKIDLEVAAPTAGVLKRIDHKDGADVKVGDVLGVIDEAQAGVPSAKVPGAGLPTQGAAPQGAEVPAAKGAEVQGAQVPSQGAGVPGARVPGADESGARTRATPAARKVAEQS